MKCTLCVKERAEYAHGIHYVCKKCFHKLLTESIDRHEKKDKGKKL